MILICIMVLAVKKFIKFLRN